MSATVFTVLCVQKSGYWFAQCLDHNIAAEGSTIEEARENWAKLFDSHLRVAEKLKIEPFTNIGEVPERYIELHREKCEVEKQVPVPLQMTVNDHKDVILTDAARAVFV